MKFIMMAGLPRAGSTLLQNLVAQNPEFLATPTTNTAHLVDSIRRGWLGFPNSWITGEEADRQQMIGACVGSALGKYAHTPAKVVFDKSRHWPNVYHLMRQRGHSKIIIVTRPLVDICASMERVYQQNVAMYGGPITKDPVPTQLGERIKYWCAAEQFVGHAYTTLKAFLGSGYKDDALWIPYDRLAKKPYETLREIYEYIDEPMPDLYKDKSVPPVRQLVSEDDRPHGYAFLHKLKEGPVAYQVSDSVQVLGKDIYEGLLKQEVVWPS